MRLFRFVILAAIVVGGAALQAAAITGATNFDTNAAGAWGSSITATSGCCQLLQIENGSIGSGFLALPFALSDGTYTLFLETSSYAPGIGGVNLFFDGSSTPGISVFGNTTTNKLVFPAFSADSANTASLTDLGVPGSGTLSYLSGATTVTLTSMQWVNSDVNGYLLGKDVQRIDLLVSTDTGAATPEPTTFLLGGLGLAGLALRRIKARA